MSGRQVAVISAIPIIRSSTGLPGLSFAPRRRRYAPCVKLPQFNAPTQPSDPFFGPRFRARLAPGKGSEFGANSPDHPCLTRPSECSFWNPVREFGGTENHPAPNHPKLGRLRCARQGLVRVPESNTKYGGKGRKPRGRPRLDQWQVSVSPQGFPSGKNLFRGVDGGFHPLFTGQVFFAALGPSGHCTSETHVALRDVAAGMPLRRWYHASIGGNVTPIPSSIAVP